MLANHTNTFTPYGTCLERSQAVFRSKKCTIFLFQSFVQSSIPIGTYLPINKLTYRITIVTGYSLYLYYIKITIADLFKENKYSLISGQ